MSSQQQQQQQQQTTPAGSSDTSASGGLTEEEKIQKSAVELVKGIINPETREDCLTKLGKTREKIPNLGIILWYTPGVMAILVQEIVAVYPILYTSIMKTHKTSICNTLSLLQCVASNPETCPSLLKSGIHLYLFPFLKVADNYRSYENLRLTSLGVIGALLKHENMGSAKCLLKTEIVSICTNVIRNGAMLSKTVAVFILQRLLRDKDGRAHICSDTAMLSDVLNALGDIMSNSGSHHSDDHQDPLERTLDCYLRIAEDQDGLAKLKTILPQEFLDGSLEQFGDKIQRKLAQIKVKLR